MPQERMLVRRNAPEPRPDHAPAAAPAQTGTDTLTPRETVVLKLIMDGQTNREAGKTLGISSRTVEFHRANIMQKLGARNVADLMRLVLGGQKRSPLS